MRNNIEIINNILIFVILLNYDLIPIFDCTYLLKNTSGYCLCLLLNLSVNLKTIKFASPFFFFSLENAYLTQSRFILMESILIWFSAFGILSYLKFRKITRFVFIFLNIKKHYEILFTWVKKTHWRFLCFSRSFSLEWWTWLCLSSISITSAIW